MLIQFNFAINELFFHLVFSLISFILLKLVIFIIDQYADKFLLTMLSDLKVKITIVTSTSSYLNKEIIPKLQAFINTDTLNLKFNDKLFNLTITNIKVYKDSHLEFNFKDGSVINIEL